SRDKTLRADSGPPTRSPRRASRCCRSWWHSGPGAWPTATANAAYASERRCSATAAPNSSTTSWTSYATFISASRAGAPTPHEPVKSFVWRTRQRCATRPIPVERNPEPRREREVNPATADKEPDAGAMRLPEAEPSTAIRGAPAPRSLARSCSDHMHAHRHNMHDRTSKGGCQLADTITAQRHNVPTGAALTAKLIGTVRHI